MAQQVCSKCGVVTDEIGNIHCRRILINDTRQLLECGRISEANELVLHPQYNEFDEKWKHKMLQDLLNEPKIRQEIDRINEQERKMLLNAPAPFMELAKKYNVDINKVVDNTGQTLLAQILIKLEKEGDLSEHDKGWLRDNNLLELLANYYYRASKIFPGNSARSLSKASSYFRKAGKPEEAIRITDGFSERPVIDLTADAAVYTSRGAAFRQLRQLDEAKQCADVAINLSPNSYYPYNLLGGISYDERDIDSGDEYFLKARFLGSPVTVWEDEIEKLHQHNMVSQHAEP